MKAIRIFNQGDLDVLQIENIEKPKPKANELLIKMKTAALNHLDLHVRKGLPGVPLPIIMGSDGSGIIEEMGDSVQEKVYISKGSEVIIVPFRTCGKCSYCLSGEEQLCDYYFILGEHLDGTQVEYICVPENYILPKPEKLTYEEAAAFPLAFMTAYHMLIRKAKIKESDWILIWGASSGIGSAAIQIAKSYKTNVIATAGDKDKMEMASKLGADFVINYKEDKVSSKVKEITEGRGVDVVFEHPGKASWSDSIRSLNKGGKLVTCGATTGPRVDLDIRHLFIKHQQIIGSTMGNRKDLLEIIDLINTGKFKPVVGHNFSFKDIKKAHQVLEDNKQQGKVVITFD